MIEPFGKALINSSAFLFCSLEWWTWKSVRKNEKRNWAVGNCSTWWVSIVIRTSECAGRLDEN